MLHKDTSYLLHLACSLCPGIGPVKFDRLVEYFGNPENILSADVTVIAQIVGLTISKNLKVMLSELNIDQVIQENKAKKIHIIHRASPSFPKRLLTLSDAPICIFVKSENDPEEIIQEIDDSICVSVIGSRKHTSYGQESTKMIVSGLASSGVIVVSGMALGIDSIAHSSTIESKGKTVAILGSGVDVIYPKENEQLYNEILKTGGCIISEFPPGVGPSKGTFIARNRLISGISAGTLVIEGDEKSGSLTTAGFAAEQGRDLFALPGPITSSLSQAPLRLLKQGAIMVTEADDILSYYNLTPIKPEKRSDFETLNAEEKILFDILSSESLFADEIAEKIKMKIEVVMNITTQLEIKGMLSRDMLGKYHISK